MTVGFGIFLIAVGAIIRYALNVNIGGVEEDTIGLILILAGIATTLLSLVLAWTARRRAVHPAEDPRYADDRERYGRP